MILVSKIRGLNIWQICVSSLLSNASLQLITTFISCKIGNHSWFQASILNTAMKSLVEFMQIIDLPIQTPTKVSYFRYSWFWPKLVDSDRLLPIDLPVLISLGTSIFHDTPKLVEYILRASEGLYPQDLLLTSQLFSKAHILGICTQLLLWPFLGE